MSDYDEQAFTLQSYTPDAAEVWNACVAQTRSASFLFFRAYMDYHASRFTDASLLFYARRGQLLAVLPACQSPADTSVVVSHAGLTYGGLLTTSAVTTSLACHMLRAACRHYAAQGYREFIYKPAPYIYKEYPAEEDLYALFRLKGRLCTRAASSVISLAQPLPWSTLRRRKVRKAALQPALVVESDAAHVPAFWQLLDVVLSTRHGVHPVHTLAEMQMLMERRKAKQPLEFPSAGSTFKRPEGYFAGALIEQAGLKGKGIGGAEVSEKHAGFVINKNMATAKDIYDTILFVIEKVKENSGVVLEPEVRMIGKF